MSSTLSSLTGSLASNGNVALEAGGVLVGDKVKIQLDIQAVKV